MDICYEPRHVDRLARLPNTGRLQPLTCPRAKRQRKARAGYVKWLKTLHDPAKLREAMDTMAASSANVVEGVPFGHVYFYHARGADRIDNFVDFHERFHTESSRVSADSSLRRQSDQKIVDKRWIPFQSPELYFERIFAIVIAFIAFRARFLSRFNALWVG